MAENVTQGEQALQRMGTDGAGLLAFLGLTEYDGRQIVTPDGNVPAGDWPKFCGHAVPAVLGYVVNTMNRDVQPDELARQKEVIVGMIRQRLILADDHPR